jgi:hypothetical protein
MGLSEFTKKLVETRMEKLCRAKISDLTGNLKRLAFRIRSDRVTLFEGKPLPTDNNLWVDIPVAQFRYNLDTNAWTLYCTDEYCKWSIYMHRDSTRNFDALLKEVVQDPTGLFWK